MVAIERVGAISADEFFEIAHSPEYEDVDVELVNGEIVIMGKAGGLHGVVTFEFGLFIGNFVKANKLGWVTAAETGYIVGRKEDGRDTVRGYDVAFVALARAPQGLPVGNIPFAPDLAVEVISPNNRTGDTHKKVLELLRAGTRLVWVAYPDTQTVVVHTPNGSRTLEADEVLEGGEVLPGFMLRVGEIFG